MEVDAHHNQMEAERVSAWDTVDPRLALGNRFKETMVYSDAAFTTCSLQRNPAKGYELIGDQQPLTSRFLNMPHNKDILARVESGVVADAVKVARVTDPAHPAVAWANLFKGRSEPSKPGYTLYVDQSIPKGTILGSVVGAISTGEESDAAVADAQDAIGKMRKAYLFDLEGSLYSRGGWVSGDRSKENDDMLVLDVFGKTNVLSLLQDIRKDPLGSLAGPENALVSTTNEVRGTANVKWIEARVNNLPRILVVAIKDIAKDDELFIDIGEKQTKANWRIYRDAKKLHDLQKMVNELADRNQQLEDDYNILIRKQVEDNRNVKLTRNTALQMAKEWEDMIEDEEGDFNTIDREQLGHTFSTHLIGALRIEVYEAELGDDDDEPATLLSEHQELIFDKNFMPKNPKEVETSSGSKKTVWVDNPDCEKFIEIQAEYGQKIYTEVGRAWQELQDLRDLTSGMQVPWNTKKEQLLENDEIVMVQTAKAMILAGYKPSNLSGDNSDSAQKRKFRKIFKVVKSQEDGDENVDKEMYAAAARRNQQLKSGKSSSAKRKNC